MTPKTFAPRYAVDENGFLISPRTGMRTSRSPMPRPPVKDGLTDEHWTVIRFIREAYEKHGMVPLVYVTCMNFKMRLKDLMRLFPAGYHRGACRLAGVAYWTAQSQQWIEVKPPVAAAPSKGTGAGPAYWLRSRASLARVMPAPVMP